MDDRPGAAGGFLAHRGLIAFATGAAMAEAALLAAFAPAARVLAPQVTALPPLAVFHDLRWLYSAHRSWLEFILLLAGLILARSAVNSLLVRLAWPGGLVNARAWYGLTGAVARARTRALAGGWAGGARLVPAVPVATLAAIAVITLMTKLVFVVGIPGNSLAAAADQVARRGQVP